jgi:hypothetical protein
MLGVRFGAVCVIAFGGVLVASPAADAVQVCDRSSGRTCKPAAVQTSREAPRATTAQRAATTTRSRHATRVTRHRHAVKHAQPARPARPTTEPVVVAPAAAPPAQEKSPAARRFSEFVSPRLLATNPVEELHKPRMNVSEFSRETAYPVAAEMDREPSAVTIDAPAPRAADNVEAAGETTPQAAPQQAPAPTGPSARVVTAPPASQVSASPVGRANSRDSSDGSAPWVRIVFLTWGGLLTLGSALRLLIG